MPKGDAANLSSIANLNPFRYRGYYFDSETGLYYLISRYYDPETGRFISADSIEYLDPETLGGLNLYAYCGNNPVMAIDPEGTKLKWWQNLLIALGGILIIAAAAVATVVTGGAAAGLLGAIAVGALKGALIGAAVGAVLGAGIGYAVGGIDGLWTGLAIGFTAGAFVGAIIGGIVGGLTFTPTSAIGTNFGKMGTVVKNPGIKVDWSKSMIHGPNKMLERGVTKRLVNSTVRKGIALSQAGGTKFAFITQKAVAVVSSSGVLVTTYGEKFFDANIQEIIKILFGG